MKIVIATAVYYPQINGVAVFSHNLAVGLAERGHEVMVICPSQTGKSYTRMIDGVKTVYLRSVDAKVYPDQIHAVPEKRKVLGVKWPRLVYRHGFRVSVFPQLEIKKVLDEFRPDVVHVQVSDPIGFSVVAYARHHHISVVTTEHNQPEVLTEPLKVPGVMKKGVNYVLSAYFRNRQSKSDFVTMPTELAIRELIGDGEKFPVPVAAVSNGVDLSHFKPGKVANEVYEEYGVPSDKPIVLYIGRVDPEKQVGLLVRAFKEARRQVPEAHLVVVGDGVDRVKLETAEKNDSQVHFLGRILPPELYDLYRMGSVFATASEIETQGIVLIEAAASGLPLIAVNKGAVAEVCRDGENGYLCQPGSVAELSAAIVKILSDNQLRKQFATESVKIAHEHDFERTLDKFINIYQRVVKLKDKEKNSDFEQQ
ncbi:glycosyltransferase [Candidatus Saccharibacteria bacterium]|nr:glycosyltransferase [Candidatus Saccharibacteria bacterium]